LKQERDEERIATLRRRLLGIIAASNGRGLVSWADGSTSTAMWIPTQWRQAEAQIPVFGYQI